MPSRLLDKPFGRGHALLIGVGGNLPCTVNDVAELRKILVDRERCGYSEENVTTLTEEDATTANIRTALARLSEAIEKEREGSTVIVYFSGHGLKRLVGRDNRYYLITAGCDPSRPKKLAKSCLSGDDFAGLLEKIRAERLLLLLDCCHAGGINLSKSDGSQLQPAPMPFDIEIEKGFGHKRGRVIVASSLAKEISICGKPCSAFTHSLLEAFCGKGASKEDGFVRAADLALYTREQVPAKTNGAQHPMLDFTKADNFEVAYYSGGLNVIKALPFSPFVPQPRSASILEAVPSGPSQGRRLTLQLMIWLAVKWSPVWIPIVLVFALLFPTIRVALFGLPEQEQMVKDAAKEYDNGFCDEERCLQAIVKAKTVIDRYQFSAQSEEGALAGTSAFPVGPVNSSVAKQIFKNGSLNSVAYSWWITARAYEKLGRPCDAVAAYESAAKFPHARTWDPQWWPLQGWSPYGWFWSPPDDAQFRITTMVQHCNLQQGGKP